MATTPGCRDKFTSLSWKIHRVAMTTAQPYLTGLYRTTTPVYNYNHIWSPCQSYQVSMSIIPGYYDNHAKLLWQPRLDTMTITVYTKLPGQSHSTRLPKKSHHVVMTTTSLHCVAMTTTPGCFCNHIPGNNQTRLPWKPRQVTSATTLGFYGNHIILQRCHGNCKAYLIQ
jgi:hypothetical protein